MDDKARRGPAHLLHLLLALALLSGSAPIEAGAAPGPEAVSADEPRLEGDPLLSPDPLSDFFLTGPERDRGHTSRESVSGPGFASVLRLATVAEASTPFAVQVTALTRSPVRSGDVLVLEVCLRGRSARGVAQTELVFEEASGAYTKSLEMTIALDDTWRTIRVPFVARGSYKRRGAQICLRAGYSPQEIEIGAVDLRNRGAGVALAGLPGSLGSYAGRGAEAPWKKAARERIERIRKSDLTVRVVDRAARPVAEVPVAVSLERHAFGFGTAVDGELITATASGGDPARYRQKVEQLFSLAVPENDLKWYLWQGPVRARAQATVRWLRERSLRVRGHTLIWPDLKYIPARLRRLSGDPDRLAQAMDKHVTEEATAFSGMVADWDVLNEPCQGRPLMDLLGLSAAAGWFDRARAADPRARLFANEDGILTRGGADRDRQDRFFGILKGLLDRGAPLDGIGLQAHFGAQLTDPETLLSILDRFAILGKPIQCTELDIDVESEELQADYLRDFMTALFSHPAVDAIVLWGFWAGRQYNPRSALYSRDWTERASGRVFTDLVHRQWRTRGEGRTDARGELVVRGFRGEYEVRVGAGERLTVHAVSLPSEGRTVTVVAE